MLLLARIRRTPSSLGALFFANFFLSLHLFSVIFFHFPTLLSRLRPKAMLFFLVLAEGLAFLILATSGHIFLSIVGFLLYLTIAPLLILTLDVILEGTATDEDKTGGVRGAYLTFQSIALAAGPLLGGFLLGDGNFAYLYGFAALLLIPLYAAGRFSARRLRSCTYPHLRMTQVIASVRKNPDIRNIFLTHFLLRLFFTFMAVYIPLYLIQEIGFSPGSIGILIAITLVPFMLLELPFGMLADKKLGEKELLIGGYVLLALSTGALSFIESSLFWVWAAALIVTRIAASMIEVTTETYFFKHVDGDDSHMMSFFRMLRPLSTLAGPVLGSVFLTFLDFRYIFLALGIVLFTGIAVAIPLRDTR